MQYTIFGATDVGKTRDHNEDAFYFSESNGFMLVSDGMGGLKAGEVASAITRDTLKELIEDFEGDNVDKFFKKAFNEANERVKRVASSNTENKGMGCTCVALNLGEADFCIAHVGDSRLYLFRNGKLKQITRDHSYVEELFMRGLISEEEKIDHPYKNSITRYIGAEALLEVDIISGPVKNDDVFLLCSDGLSGEVDDSKITEIISNNDNVENIVKLLIDEANQNGGGDNITVVVCKVKKKKAGFFNKLLGW